MMPMTGVDSAVCAGGERIASNCPAGPGRESRFCGRGKEVGCIIILAA